MYKIIDKKILIGHLCSILTIALHVDTHYDVHYHAPHLSSSLANTLVSAFFPTLAYMFFTLNFLPSIIHSYNLPFTFYPKSSTLCPLQCIHHSLTPSPSFSHLPPYLSSQLPSLISFSTLLNPVLLR